MEFNQHLLLQWKIYFFLYVVLGERNRWQKYFSPFLLFIDHCYFVSLIKSPVSKINVNKDCALFIALIFLIHAFVYVVDIVYCLFIIIFWLPYV